MRCKRSKTKSQKRPRQKKGLISFTIAGALLFGGSINAFAEETNLGSKVKEYTEAVVNSLLPQIDQQIAELSATSAKSISAYVETSFKNFQEAINDHVKKETKRAEKEIKDYLKQKEKEVDNKFETELSIQKQKITEDTNRYIEEEQAKIDKRFEPGSKTETEQIAENNPDSMQVPNMEETEVTQELTQPPVIGE